MTRPTRKELRDRLAVALATRLSPERTRRATRFESMTVQRLSWEQVVKLNRYLELFGKLTTGVWFAFIAAVVLGLDWKQTLENTVNSGEPVRGLLALAFFLPTLLFVAAHSLVGFARWRLQRELWRRDVERVAAPDSQEG